jgi:hypothetical protein
MILRRSSHQAPSVLVISRDERTVAETSLVNDLHSLMANEHLTSAELRILARLIDNMRVMINEQENLN